MSNKELPILYLYFYIAKQFLFFLVQAGILKPPLISTTVLYRCQAVSFWFLDFVFLILFSQLVSFIWQVTATLYCWRRLRSIFYFATYIINRPIFIASNGGNIKSILWSNSTCLTNTLKFFERLNNVIWPFLGIIFFRLIDKWSFQKTWVDRLLKHKILSKIYNHVVSFFLIFHGNSK